MSTLQVGRLQAPVRLEGRLRGDEHSENPSVFSGNARLDHLRFRRRCSRNAGKTLARMVPSARFERAALDLEGRCSIQLSYEGTEASVPVAGGAK